MSNGARPIVRPWFLKTSIVVFLLLTPFVVLSAWDFLESWRLAKNIADVKAWREPTSVFEIQPYRTLTGQDADSARYYRAAAALATPNYNPKGGRSASSPAADEALALIDRAAPLRFEAIYSGYTYSYLTSELLIVERLASARTRSLGEQHAGTAAANSLYSQVRLFRAISSPGTATAMVSRPIDDLEFVLSNSRPDGESLKRLADVFAEFDQDDGMKRMLIRERAFLLDSVARSMRGVTFYERPLALRVLNERLEHQRLLIEHASWPWPRRLDTSTVSETRDGLRDVDQSRVRMAAQSLARIRSARIAIAAMQYRGAHGSWPADVRAVTPEFLRAIPIDPYRGEPMKAIAESDSSFVAYSVGLNNRDERGKLMPFSGAVRTGMSPAMADGDIGVRITFH